MNGKSWRVFFISGLLLLLQTVLYAQGKITGSVLDRQSSDPLPAANVYIEGTNYGSSTDLNGKFVISQVPVGNYKMVVKYIGYQEKTVDISVKVGETLNIVVNLDFQSVEGEVVTVTAKAEGQMAAINEQLSSNTISNIVSQSRIKEVP